MSMPAARSSLRSSSATAWLGIPAKIWQTGPSKSMST